MRTRWDSSHLALRPGSDRKYELCMDTSLLNNFVVSGTYGVVVDWKEVVNHYSNADNSCYDVRLGHPTSVVESSCGSSEYALV